ncbi:unnamed protein product [Malus baccata var. baccata]
MASSECCSNPPALNPSSGSGHVEKLGGFDSYVTGSPDSKLAVLLVHDAFGYEAPKARMLADKIAAAGFIVVLPDFFNRDPFNGDLASLPVWLKAHAPDKTIEDAKLVIEALKSKGVSAIGAVGFCWGGKGVVELAKHDFIQAAVLCHPSFVTLDDIKGKVSVFTAKMFLRTHFSLFLPAKFENDNKPVLRDGCAALTATSAHGCKKKQNVVLQFFQERTKVLCVDY